MNIYRRLLIFSNRSGTGAAMIEFGFVAPIFITLLIGIFEVGTMLIVQNSLDAAAREAARFGITGQTDPGNSRSKTIEARVYEIIEAYSGGIADPSLVSIKVSAYNAIEAINQPEPFSDANGNGIYDFGEFYEDSNNNGTWDADQGVSNSFGIAGNAVMYEISYDWDSILPIFGDSITLRGSSPVVNEAFK